MEPKTFEEFVTWATWSVISDITQGRPLKSAIHSILSYFAQWSYEQRKAKESQNEQTKQP